MVPKDWSNINTILTQHIDNQKPQQLSLYKHYSFTSLSHCLNRKSDFVHHGQSTSNAKQNLWKPSSYD